MLKSLIKRFLHFREEKALKKQIITTNEQKRPITTTVKRFCFKYGFSYDDYYNYELYKNNRKNYINTIDSFAPRLLKNQSMFCVSDNKVLFELFMSHFFCVPENIAYIDENENVRLIHKSGQVVDYLMNGSFICKPFGGYNGHEIECLNVANDSFTINNKTYQINELINQLKQRKNCVIQRKIEQNAYSNNIFPDSVNTIRIISASLNGGEHDIICAVHRFGTKKSAPADNFARGGLTTIIDLKTGKMGKLGGTYLSENGVPSFYSNHPDTGAKVENVCIPLWNEIKNKIIDFSKHFHFFKFIAWDIVIDKNNDICIIETNMKSSLDIFQIHGGLKNTKLDLVLQEFKNEKR